MDAAEVRILAITVGNTRTGFGLFQGREPISTRSQPNADFGALIDGVAAAAGELEGHTAAAIVMATVNPDAADRLEEALASRAPRRVHHIGRDVPVPMAHALGQRHTTGQDRMLAAYAAHQQIREACVVIDAGTAITVDFVDGEGIFQGGAILPGLHMALRALHQGTAALPEVALARPDDGEPIAKNTAQAMLNGAFYGARGAVRMLAERYAELYAAYPRILATGGDAELLFSDDELIERIVPDLVLHGVAMATLAALDADETGDFALTLGSAGPG